MFYDAKKDKESSAISECPAVALINVISNIVTTLFYAQDNLEYRFYNKIF